VANGRRTDLAAELSHLRRSDGSVGDVRAQPCRRLDGADALCAYRLHPPAVPVRGGSSVATTRSCPTPELLAAGQNRKGDQQGTRSYPRRRSAVSIASSTREVMPGTSTGRRPAT
jgi:hypothetical protein